MKYRMFDQKEIDHNADDLFKKLKEETILQYERFSEDKDFIITSRF